MVNPTYVSTVPKEKPTNSEMAEMTKSQPKKETKKEIKKAPKK